MEKRKKIIAVIVAVVVVLVTVIVLAVTLGRQEYQDTQEITQALQETETTQADAQKETDAENGSAEDDKRVNNNGDQSTKSADSPDGTQEYVTVEEIPEEKTKKKKKDDPLKNIEVYEETRAEGAETKAGGDDEDYPGKDEGWSPIVSPDDLK